MTLELSKIALISFVLFACNKPSFKASSGSVTTKPVVASTDAVKSDPEAKVETKVTVETGMAPSEEMNLPPMDPEPKQPPPKEIPNVEPHLPEPPIPKQEFAFPIGECVTKWGGGELIQKIAKNPKVVDLNSFIKGDLLFEDQTVTTAPVFYLLNINFDIAAHAQMYLKNPKGYYCVNIVAKSVRDFDIDVACTTEVTTATRPGQYFNTLNIHREMTCR
jgi:hypothetical protein